MRSKRTRLIAMLLIVGVLVAATPPIALAHGTAGPTPKIPVCTNTTMEPWDVGYGGHWSNTLAAYTDIEVTIYQRYDPNYQVWCGGFQTGARFKIERQQLSEICYAPNVTSQVRQYRNGAYNQINGPTVHDCDIWHSSGFVPGLPDASSGSFYGLARWSSIDGNNATTHTWTQ